MVIAPKLFNCRVNMTILLKPMMFLLIIFEKSNRHRGSIAMTAFVRPATHTLQIQNILWHLEAVVNIF